MPRNIIPGRGLFWGGLLNISGGTFDVLSGSRLEAYVMNESAGSTLVIGLDGPSADSNGLIAIDDTALFAGALDVTLENGFEPVIGEQFQLFSFGSETGQFSTINLPDTIHWDISQLYTAGIITAIPEPAATAACAVGLLMLRRRAR